MDAAKALCSELVQPVGSHRQGGTCAAAAGRRGKARQAGGFPKVPKAFLYVLLYLNNSTSFIWNILMTIFIDPATTNPMTNFWAKALVEKVTAPKNMIESEKYVISPVFLP